MISKTIAGAGLIVLCVLSPVHGGAQLALDGKPTAEIVVDAEAHPAVAFAAEELQLWIREISGAALPIVHAPGVATQRIRLGVVGSSTVLGRIPNRFPADVAKLQGNDGYAVRTVGADVYLFASVPKGVLNGIHKLLFRNTDIIWARPNVEFGTVFSKTADLALAQTDYLDVPTYVLRGWQMIGRGRQEKSELWQVRNGTNWSARMTGNPNYLKHGIIMEYGGGHNLTTRYITEKKYFDAHPEFFIMKDGERIRPSARKYKTQLCFTNPAMTKAFIAELDQRIRANPQFTTYRVMIEDTWEQCECPECLKQIRLADGTVLEPGKRGSPFRSTQFFIWLNQLAEHLLEHHPGKRILTFGYFFTATPPKVKVAPNISISFCPITKNSRERLTGPTNTVWHTRFLDWMKITDQLTWREYFGLVGPFPRPTDVIALSDLALVHTHGINRTYSELYGDEPGRRMDGTKAWDLNAMYSWTMTQGLWNPGQDVHALRAEFRRRVYGAGAEDVGEFYRLIEGAWFKGSGSSRWNDSVTGNWLRYVVKKQLQAPLRAALERAVPKVVHPNGQQMLAALRRTFEEQVGALGAMTMRGSGAQAVAKPPFDPDFRGGDWAKAEPLSQFYNARETGLYDKKTVVRVLYDDKALYLGTKCFDKEVATLHSLAAGQPRDKWPAGDKFEIFLTGRNGKKSCYYQLVYDVNGNRFDARGKDVAWNGAWQVVTRTTADGWSSLVTVPWTDLGLAGGARPASVDALFLRYWNHGQGSGKLGFWFAGSVHEPDTFCPISLK